MVRNFEKMRHGMFSRVIRENIVAEPRWHSRINTAFIRWAVSQPRVTSDIRSKQFFEKPESNPHTLLSWENTVGLVSAPAGVVPWLVELSRIAIPESNVGVLKSLEQYVFHDDVQNPAVYSISGNWGNPFVLASTALTVTWFFRLERVTGNEPAWINVSTLTPRSALPGEPGFEIPEMRDLWFPAGSPASQNVHMTIGGRYRLRVLALVERSADFSMAIACKIRGFRLSAFDDLTLLPIRAIW